MKRLHLLIAATIPVSWVGTMSWFGTYTFVNAYIIRGLGHSNQEWTVTSLWYAGGMIGWYLFGTEVSARLGRRWTVTVGLAVTTWGYFLLAFVGDLRIIGPILALMGFTTVANAIAWTPLVAEAEHERPGRALALTAFVGTAVGAICLLAGGRLIAGENYRATFLVIAATCAVGTAAFHAVSYPLRDVAPSQVVSLWRFSRSEFAALFRGPFLVIVLAGVCIDPFSFHTANQLFPNLARDVHGFREGDIGTLVALGRVPALVSLYIISRVIDRLNIVRWYALGLLADGIATIVLGAIRGQAPLIAAYLVFYLVHGVVWGTVVAAVNTCLPGRLRDSGYAITWLLEILAVFLVGIVHNRLLGGGATLPTVFIGCGAVLSTSGAFLMLYSSTCRKTD